MVERMNFDDEIFSNKIKSFLLLMSIVIVIIAIGFAISQFLDPSFFFIILIISIVFSMVYTIGGYYYSDKIALASVRAKPADKYAHRVFFDAIENMSLASGLPKPRIYVMESEQINAFASGRDPKNAVICVTTGALKKLDKRELEGVIAHEMAHIANYDIRFMTLTAILVGMVSIIAEIYLRSLWFGSSDRREGKGNAVLLIVGIVLAIIAPIVVQLVSLAISRKREFVADANGVKFTRYPLGLSNALRKIKGEHHSDRESKEHYTKAIAPLFISDPFKKKITNLFSTHPDVDERIRRIENM